MILEGAVAVDRAAPAALPEVVLPMAGLLGKTLHAIVVPAGQVVPRMEVDLPTVIVVAPVVPPQMAAVPDAALPIVALEDPAALARVVPEDSVSAVPADSAAAVAPRPAKFCRPRWSTN